MIDVWVTVEFSKEDYLDITETASERAVTVGVLMHDAVMDSLYK